MDDFDSGTKERVLPQGIYNMQNMKALSLTIQKLWPMKSFCEQTNGPTDKQTGQKLYVLNLSILRH